jgi:hypothetical protein
VPSSRIQNLCKQRYDREFWDAEGIDTGREPSDGEQNHALLLVDAKCFEMATSTRADGSNGQTQRYVAADLEM